MRKRTVSVATKFKEKEIEELSNKMLIEQIYCLTRVLSSDSAIPGLSEARNSILSEGNKEFVELKLLSLIKKLG